MWNIIWSSVQIHSYNTIHTILFTPYSYSELCDIHYIVNSEGMNESAVLDTAQYVHEGVNILIALMT